MKENKVNQSSQKPSFWQMVASTLLSFLGVSKESRRRRDFEHGNPKVFIVTGFIITLLFIMTVLIAVKLVLAN